ncbi:hypothetical protein BH11ARM1_BH11ARM1_18110 [soil metagenome]
MTQRAKQLTVFGLTACIVATMFFAWRSRSDWADLAPPGCTPLTSDRNSKSFVCDVQTKRNMDALRKWASEHTGGQPRPLPESGVEYAGPTLLVRIQDRNQQRQIFMDG